MYSKRVIAAAFAALTLSLPASLASAEEISTAPAVSLNANTSAGSSNGSVVLARAGGGGGSFGHSGGGGSFGHSMGGMHAFSGRSGAFGHPGVYGRTFYNHGHFAGNRFFFRHHNRRFFAGPFYGDYGYGYDYDYDDSGSCYWNCRQVHGPAYCRAYAGNYCD
jgi:hypothetical protein